MKFVTKSPVIPWDDGLAHRIRPTARFIAASLCSLDLRRLDIVEAIRGKPWNISEVFLTRSPVPKDLCQGVVSRSHPPSRGINYLSRVRYCWLRPRKTSSYSPAASSTSTFFLLCFPWSDWYIHAAVRTPSSGRGVILFEPWNLVETEMPESRNCC